MSTGVVARLQGRVAIVTGATSGIGAETVRRLLADGAFVLATGRSERRGHELTDELGDHVAFAAFELTEPDAPEQLVRAAVERFGRLDVLVNNAARDHTGPLLEVPADEIREVFELNVFAATALLQSAAVRMRERGGAIVNVTSRLASVGVPTMAVYGAAKGAMLALTRGAAVELAPLGIRVNAVAPGMTATPLYDEWVRSQPDPEAVARETAARIPQGRLARPADVAATIAWLASDDADHVTGASIPVDGGYTAA